VNTDPRIAATSDLRGFAAVARPDAKILILGSMPGKRSLEMQQYYAFPQNAFWRIMGKLFGFDPLLPYPERLDKLQTAGLALWDVMAGCRRQSSLDADIVESSIVSNDFNGFLDSHAQIAHIYCNGAKACQSFLRHVTPALRSEHQTIEVSRLPSTSPAHASMTFQAKLDAWKTLKTAL